MQFKIEFFKDIPLYREWIRLEFIKMLAYRVTYFSGIFNYTIQMGTYFFLWGAIYQGQARIGGLAQQEMLTYVIIAWVARAFYFNNLDRQIAEEIRKGQIALELIRPYNYQLVKFARSFGEAAFRMIFYALPSFLIVYVFYPFQLPSSAASAFIFFLTMLGAYLINAQISLITGFIAFFTLNTHGVIRAKRVVVDLFSGLLIPISFYPDWAREVIQYFPFQAISYLPNMIYIGKITGMAAFQVFLTQILWAIVLYALAALIWRVAVKNVVIQGG